MRATARDEAYVLKEAKKCNIKFVKMWFADILGFLKSFAMTVDELEGALEGMSLTASS